MADAPEKLLRATFEQVADLYDRARPNYPRQIVDDLASLAGLPPRARVVEIGCGTGQATVPLAERGYTLTGVELGAQLAAVTRRKLARFPNAEVINANFETWEPERVDFDAIVAFTAFHWISTDARYTRTAELLRDDGKLAIVSTSHVLPPDGDRFFVEVQNDYEALLRDDPATKADAGGPPRPDDVADLGEEIASSG